MNIINRNKNLIILIIGFIVALYAMLYFVFINSKNKEEIYSVFTVQKSILVTFLKLDKLDKVERYIKFNPLSQQLNPNYWYWYDAQLNICYVIYHNTTETIDSSNIEKLMLGKAVDNCFRDKGDAISHK